MFKTIAHRLPLAVKATSTAKLFHSIASHGIQSIAPPIINRENLHNIHFEKNNAMLTKPDAIINDIKPEQLHEYAKSLLIATCLNFASHVRNVKKTIPLIVKELNAEGISIPEAHLKLLLDNLVRLGIFKVDDDEHYGISTVGSQLINNNIRKELVGNLSRVMGIDYHNITDIHANHTKLNQQYTQLLGRLESEKTPLPQSTNDYLKNIILFMDKDLSKAFQNDKNKFENIYKIQDAKHLVHLKHHGTFSTVKDSCPGHLFENHNLQMNRI